MHLPERARLTRALSACRDFYFVSGALPQAKIEAAPTALQVAALLSAARSSRSVSAQLSSQLSPECVTSISRRVPRPAPADYQQRLSDRAFDFPRRNRSPPCQSVVVLGVYDALKERDLPDGHVIVGGRQFESKERAMEAIHDIALSGLHSPYVLTGCGPTKIPVSFRFSARVL